MVRRTTWITLGGFLAVLMLALILLQSRGEAPSVEATPPPNPIWVVQSSEIAAISIEDHAADKTLRLERHEQDLWRAIPPEAGEIDVVRVERAASWLSAPVPRSELTQIDDLSTYQLDEPHFRVEVLLSNGERKLIEVGRETPTGDARYITSPGLQVVWIVRSSGLEEVLDLFTNLQPPDTEG